MKLKEWLIKNKDIQLEFTGKVEGGGWLVFTGTSVEGEVIGLSIRASIYDRDIWKGDTETLGYLASEDNLSLGVVIHVDCICVKSLFE